jgi:hypothetical protein
MKEAAKPDFLDMDKDGNKKEPMKKAIADKSVKEELKGNQHRIDANNNNKIDAQDFKILKAKKKVKEGREFTEKLLETVRKSDIPAYLRKAKGDTPLTVADVKAPRKDSISASQNLAKARNEEVEQVNEDNLDSIAKKHGMELKKTTYGAGMKHPTHGEVSINRYGEWNHYPAGSKSSKAHGNSTDNFASLDKHLSSLKEEVELHESLMDHIEVKAAKKHKDPEILAVHDVHYKGKKIGDIQVYQHGSGMKYGSHHDATGNSAAGHRTMDQAIDDIRQEHAQHLKSMREEVEHLDEEQLDEMINEVLGKDATAGDYIHDFVHSDNPKFAGKSKAERKKMALGAYYGAQKEAYEPSEAAITTDTLAGRMPGGKSNSFKSFKTRVRPLAKEGEQKPGDDTPEIIQPQDTPARKSHEVKEATIAGTPGWEKIKTDVKDKSGAVHTPMSRARDLAQQALKTVQNKTKVK